LNDTRQQARIAPRRHQAALRARLATGESADGCAHLRIREIQLRLAQSSLRARHGSLRALERRESGVAVVHTGQLLVVYLQNPVAFAARLRQVRLLDRQIRSRTGRVRGESCRIDTEQQVVGADAGTVTVRLLQQDARYLRAHLDLADAA